MNNYVSLLIAVLEHLGTLTETEAKKLAKDLSGSTIPGTYDEASRMVKDLFNKYEVQSLSSKIKK